MKIFSKNRAFFSKKTAFFWDFLEKQIKLRHKKSAELPTSALFDNKNKKKQSKFTIILLNKQINLY